jgi:peptide deformylase
MAVRPIVRLGYPALRSQAGPLPPERLGEPAAQQLIDDLIETMRAAPGGVGLAAPQLGVELQIFVYEVPAPAAAADDPGDPAGSPAGPLAGPPTDQKVRADRGLRRATPPKRHPIPLHVVINPMIAAHGGEPVYD